MVEDHSDSLEALRIYLESFGYVILSARSAIAMSGYGMKADRERSARAGFRHHLIKPVSVTKLTAILQEAVAELRNQ